RVAAAGLWVVGAAGGRVGGAGRGAFPMAGPAVVEQQLVDREVERPGVGGREYDLVDRDRRPPLVRERAHDILAGLEVLQADRGPVAGRDLRLAARADVARLVVGVLRAAVAGLGDRVV